MFRGAITALVTPMRGGQLDLDGLRALVELQITEGIDGLVACGTTGETPTLDVNEQALVIRTVVEQTKRRVPVLAGAGANATAQAIALSRAAAECGADGLLHVTPYYNKPTQAGLLAHFRALSVASSLPIVLYNVPGRTGCDLLPETVAELAQHERIVGLKEASGSIVRGQQVIAACQRVRKDFSVLSGDDPLALALTAVGGQGVISVISNVAPKLMAQLVRLASESQIAEARAIHYRLLRLMELLFCESNPIPIKAAVALLGFGANELRLPLLPLSGAKLEELSAELKRLGIAQ
ncbi:MAG: 4-hydroxy-tetrahydrodipicolinate synthase [Proteobacteria bacterium]|nr:4-hydroxy-tetrahydrodipicolinate synthase [Pseudomonadota bacterium]